MAKKKQSLIKQCVVCRTKRTLKDFIKHPTTEDGYDVVCNSCRKKIAKDFNGLKKYLEISGRSFSPEIWGMVLEIVENKYKDNLKDIEEDKRFSFIEEKAIALYFSKINLKGIHDDAKISGNGDIDFNYFNTNGENIDELKRKWGEDFTPQELLSLENYVNELNSYYTIESPVHKNLIKMAAMNAVLAERALREGRIQDYSKLQSAYSSILTDSKLKPNQRSAVEDGALATVSQWVEKIEAEDGFIPQYITEKPDVVDKTIELFIEKMKQNLGIG